MTPGPGAREPRSVRIFQSILSFIAMWSTPSYPVRRFAPCVPAALVLATGACIELDVSPGGLHCDPDHGRACPGGHVCRARAPSDWRCYPRTMAVPDGALWDAGLVMDMALRDGGVDGRRDGSDDLRLDGADDLRPLHRFVLLGPDLPAELELLRAQVAFMPSYDGPKGLVYADGPNVPRFASDGAMPLGLLLEGARTNFARSSEAFEAAPPWILTSPEGTTQVTAYAADAPDGTKTARRITCTGEGGKDSCVVAIDQPLAANGLNVGDDITFSIWIRSDSPGRITLRAGTSAWGSGAAASDVQREVEYGVLWRRVAVTYLRYEDLAGSRRFRAALVGFHSSSTFELWGAQIERGRVPTSYVASPDASTRGARNAEELRLRQGPAWHAGRFSVAIRLKLRPPQSDRAELLRLANADDTQWLTVHREGAPDAPLMLNASRSSAGGAPVQARDAFAPETEAWIAAAMNPEQVWLAYRGSVTSGTHKLESATLQTLRISPASQPTSERGLEGYVQELRLWNRTLSTDDLVALTRP